MEIEGVAALPVGQDALVFVRTKASAVDKSIFEALKKKAVQELVEGGKPALSRDLASLFTCGWLGFTVDGLPVPYSWPVLEQVLGEEGMDKLAKFVALSVDILK